MTADLSQQAEALIALSERATPPDAITDTRYEHGGSRSFAEIGGDKNNLIADFYTEGDREFWIAARTTAPALAAAYLAMQWRPIATAPRDKTMVALLHVGARGYRKYGVGRYMPIAGWQGMGNGEDYAVPTHWMPLPTPPTGGDHEAES